MSSTVIAGLVGVIVGALLTQILSAAREHHNWINDQKRKELLGLLYETVSVVAENRPNGANFNHGPVNEAVKKMSRAFEDRIFVADRLKEVGANNDWLAMKSVIYYEPDLQEQTPREFWYTTNNL